MRYLKWMMILAGTLAFEAARGESFDFPPPAGLGPRGGETPLVDHLPHNFGGLASDTLFTVEPGGQPFPWQLVADDFVLPVTTVTRRVVFFAFYYSNILPVGDETIRVRFHNARPSDGLPGTELYSESFVNVPRVWTGRNVIAAGGGREYRFEVLLGAPFAIDADTKYWLEIAQIGDLSTHFRWEQSVTAPANSQAVSNPNFPNWHLPESPGIDPNTAFQLFSIPEPDIAALLSIGILISHGVFRVRRSRRTRV